MSGSYILGFIFVPSVMGTVADCEVLFVIVRASVAFYQWAEFLLYFFFSVLGCKDSFI